MQSKGITIIQLSPKEIKSMIAEAIDTGYDSVFGMSKESMMKKLEIKSETTFYDRLRRGKIISKEVGGSNRYFLPNFKDT